MEVILKCVSCTKVHRNIDAIIELKQKRKKKQKKMVKKETNGKERNNRKNNINAMKFE